MVCPSLLPFSTFTSYVVCCCTCTRIHRETRLKARANGAVSRGGTGRPRERAGDAGMRRRVRARAERRSEQERSSLRRRSASLCRAPAAKSATLDDNVWLFLLVLFVCFFPTIILLVRKASSARASEQGVFLRGGVGGEPGDDGSERAMPKCDDGFERERSEAPSKSGARCAAVQLPFIELVPPRARRCTTTCFFFYSLYLFL